jgi:hypothetical protein
MGTYLLQLQLAETENTSRIPVKISENIYTCVCVGIWNAIACNDRCVLCSQYICMWSHLIEKAKKKKTDSRHLLIFWGKRFVTTKILQFL